MKISKKAVATYGGVALTLLGQYLGWAPTTLGFIAGLLAIYTGGVAHIDAKKIVADAARAGIGAALVSAEGSVQSVYPSSPSAN